MDGREEDDPIDMSLVGGEVLRRELAFLSQTYGASISAVDFVYLLEQVDQDMAAQREPVGDDEIW